MAQLLPDYTALALYTYLAMRVYSENGYTFSQEHLAGALGMSLSTVYRKTQLLVDKKVITIEHTLLPNGERGWNKYYIVHNIPADVKLLVYATNGHGRPVPPVTGDRYPPVTRDRYPQSPVTALHRQGNKKTRGTETNNNAEAVSIPHRVNEYEGTCLHCGKYVAAGAGRLVGKSPAHLDGKCPRRKGREHEVRNEAELTEEDYLL